MVLRKKSATIEMKAYCCQLLIYSTTPAVLYLHQSLFSKAKPHLLRALVIQNKAFSSEHPEFIASLRNLAALYVGKCEYDKAEKIYKDIIDIQEKSIGSEHLYLAESLEILAELYLNQDDYDKADPLISRAQAIKLNSLGIEIPGFINGL